MLLRLRHIIGGVFVRKYHVFLFCISIVLLIWLLPSHKNNEAGNVPQPYEYYYNEDDEAEDDALQPTPNDIPIDGADTYAEGAATPVETGAVTVPMDLEPDSLTVFINKEFGLPAKYEPEDLMIPKVLFNFSYRAEKNYLRREAGEALERLFATATKQGLSLYAISGYRSYKRQNEIYNRNVQQRGAIATNAVSAVPGYSEHQSGLSMDVSCPSIQFRLNEAFSGTPEGLWLAKNSYRFGFIIRYPKGKSHLTGYSYEPWHIRFVGKELASLLYENNLTLEEYYNYKPKKNLVKHAASDMVVDVEDVKDVDTDDFDLKGFESDDSDSIDSDSDDSGSNDSDSDDSDSDDSDSDDLGTDDEDADDAEKDYDNFRSKRKRPLQESKRTPSPSQKPTKSPKPKKKSNAIKQDIDFPQSTAKPKKQPSKKNDDEPTMTATAAPSDNAVAPNMIEPVPPPTISPQE